MASTAEVDLVISTADTLPQLERELTEIIRAAEADADSVELQALLDADTSLNELVSDLDAILRTAEADVDPVELEARLEQAQSLSDLQDDLRELIHDAEATAQQIELDAAIDADIAELDAELAALVAELEASAPDVNLDVNVDRDGRGASAASRLGRAFKDMLPSIGKATGVIGAAGLAVASTASLASSLVVALENIAPAAAVGVSGMATLALASGTVQVAMIGVGDAVKAAFDPDVKPEKLAEAMDRLAPPARAFVAELQSMKKSLSAIQQDVQGRFFQGLDFSLNDLGTNVLPKVSAAMKSTADILNTMARGAALAAVDLGKDGTLGRALDSSVASLGKLTRLPAQLTRGLGQVAAAAGPSLERISAAAASAGDKISAKLEGAFKSGALELAINRAVDAIAQLGRIAGNVFEGLGNIMRTVSTEGGGLFGTLEKITQAFADVTATQGFKDALTALVQVMNTLVATALPLISTALQTLGPVFQALGPPIQLLVGALGDALTPIVKALGPVLVALSLAFGRLVGFVTPFLDLASKLITAALPILTPLLTALGTAINAMIPFAKQLADTFAQAIAPVLTTLATTVLPQLLPPLVQLSTAIFPVLTKILVALTPSLIKLGETFASLLVALTPLLVELTNLVIKLGQELSPIIEPLIALMLKLTTGALGVLVAQLNGVVIPALKILVDLLRGDFSAAFEGAKTLVTNIWNKIAELTGIMASAVVAKLRELVGQVGEKVIELTNRAVQGFQNMVTQSADEVAKLPGRILTGLGNLSTLLYDAGADVVRGFISGLSSQLSRLREIASDIGDVVQSAVGKVLDMHSPSRVMREMGQNTMEGFKLGIGDGLASLGAQVQGVGNFAPSFAAAGSQALQLPQTGSMTPTVQVYLGNELLDKHVDTRIARSNQARDLLSIRGVRR